MKASTGKPTVFISYSHKDKKALDMLLPFLDQLELNEHIALWHDRLIGVGEDWYAEIQEKLESAKVAILIVTQNFLASRFCKHEEIPVLLQRARRGRLWIFPILFEDCLYEDEPWLRRMQMTPDASKPLCKQGKNRPTILKEMAKRVRDAAAGKVPPPVDALKKWPLDQFDLRRLPETGSLLFGRRRELKLLDTAWDNRQTGVLAFTAGGGVGKSTLVRVWCEMLAEDHWRGAERAFAWSFYSQGTGRMTSSDLFVDLALRFFGDKPPPGLSPWDKGARLAGFVRKQRTLLVLDGVEPLQSGAALDRGALRDPGLKTLLECLAKDNPGLCLVTTREKLRDLEEFTEPSVVQHDLDQISALDGRALLRVAGVKGKDEDLENAVANLGHHALAINLLATYIAETPGAHIATHSDLPPRSHEEEANNDVHGHPRRVMNAWAKRLGPGPELQLLHLVGFFDLPAQAGAIDALIQPPVFKELNDHLQGDTSAALARLRRARILARESSHDPGNLDAHPLVREHFGEQLEKANPKAFKEGHRRLYEYLKGAAKELPDTIDQMTPLYAAAYHGCRAGLHQKALDEVYWPRIIRSDEFFSTRKLGAFGADLATLSGFFAQPWTRPVDGLAEPDKASALNLAGFRLRALGWLAEAAEPLQAGLESDITRENWMNAARAAKNLSELHLCRGDLGLAIEYAQKGVDLAERSKHAFERMVMRTTLADALHQAGRIPEAHAGFAEAEQMQKERQPEYLLLYSLQGFQYCDLLLGQAQYQEVVDRAGQTLEWAIRNALSLLDIALNHLSLGRAELRLAQTEGAGDLAKARAELNAAVDGLRQAGRQDHLPRGLQARAELWWSMEDFTQARADLDETLSIAVRGGMRLFEADCYLGLARLSLAMGDRDSARGQLTKAKGMISEMKYGRRFGEVAELEQALGPFHVPPAKST